MEELDLILMINVDDVCLVGLRECTGFVICVVLWGKFWGYESFSTSYKNGTSSKFDNGSYVRYIPKQNETLERFYHECSKSNSIFNQQLIKKCLILSHIELKSIKVWFRNWKYCVLQHLNDSFLLLNFRN